MADQNQANVTQAKAETRPSATEAKAPATTAPAKAEAAKTETPAKASEAGQPARKAAKATRTKATRTAKRAKPAAKRTPARKAKPARKPAAKTVKPAARAARAGANAMNQGAKTMNKQTEKTIEAGQQAAEQFRAVFGDVNQRAKGAVERSARIVEELADLTRGNVEALVASSKLAAKGVETLGQEAAEYSRKSFEEASSALRSFAEVKSATDFFRLQGDYARSAFDTAVAESARLSETMLKLAGDVAEPITSRYTVAAERAKTLAA